MAEESGFTTRPPVRVRIGVALLVIVLHLLAIAALIRALAPNFVGQVTQAVVSTFSVTITTPPPSPAPQAAPEAAGGAGASGRKAVARAVKAEASKIDLTKAHAPLAASSGSAETSGAGPAGTGTGAQGTGQGTGSGAGGDGAGLARKVEKIGGAIRDKDYPKEGRAARLGNSVTIALDVSAEGRPTACRIVHPGPDPAADAITCKLALERFRFRPASDRQGNPVASVFGWKQWWYY